MAKIGVESSEIMASVAMLMTPTKLDSYLKKGFVGLVSFLKDGLEIAKSNKVIYPTADVKTKFLKAFIVFGNSDDPYFIDKDFLTAAVQGISAAKSIRDWVPTRSKQSGVPITNMVCDKVFLTGDSWPTEVAKFQVNAFGFTSYNSSDLILNWGDSYYGISLKKKPTLDDPDPTIINKAFDTVLSGKDFDELKESVEKAREKYFAGIIREGTKERPPASTKPYLTFVGGKLPSVDKEVMKISLLEKSGKPRRKLINIKGKGTINLKNLDDIKFHGDLLFKKSSEEDGSLMKNPIQFSNADMKNKAISFRAYVNSRVASRDSVFDVMVEVMNQYSNEFAKSLINLVLKRDMYDLIQDNTFAFGLTTGIGRLDKNLSPVMPIQVEKTKGLHTVICGLSVLEQAKTKYKVVLDDAENDKADAAKVYFKLMKGKVNVLDLQLRYKGSFSSQPQFFATISDDFKNVLFGSSDALKKCLRM